MQGSNTTPIYTYEFTFETDDDVTYEVTIRDELGLYHTVEKSEKGIETIQFCAETLEEAEALFYDWCRVDEKRTEPYLVQSVEIVYNESDHQVYGDRYRC